MNELGTKIYSVDDLNDANWKKYYMLSQNNKNDYTSYHLEHHIGRFNSIKKILGEIKHKNTKTDFLEFGTWKGHSFYNILNIMEHAGFDSTISTITGIDGFIGIPEGYGHVCCPDKLFNNTSYNECLNNIKQRQSSFPNQKYYLLETLYNNSGKILDFFKEQNITKVSFVHLDCDVVKSCEEVLDLLINNNLLSETFYLHFDDWGIKTGIPEWFTNYNKLSHYEIIPLYETRITKSFKITNK